jgi:hypothetical protein
MCHYISKSGKRQRVARRGQQAEIEKSRLKSLVKKGLASPWAPLRNVDDAIARAGLNEL